MFGNGKLKQENKELQKENKRLKELVKQSAEINKELIENEIKLKETLILKPKMDKHSTTLINDLIKIFNENPEFYPNDINIILKNNKDENISIKTDLTTNRGIYLKALKTIRI